MFNYFTIKTQNCVCCTFMAPMSPPTSNVDPLSKRGSVKSCVPMCPSVSQGISAWLIIVWCEPQQPTNTPMTLFGGKNRCNVHAPVSPSSLFLFTFASAIFLTLHHIVQLRRMGLRIFWQSFLSKSSKLLNYQSLLPQLIVIAPPEPVELEMP